MTPFRLRWILSLLGLWVALGGCEQPAEKAERLVQEARQALAQNDLDTAEHLFSEARAASYNADALLGQAGIFSRRGQWQKAAATLKECDSESCRALRNSLVPKVLAHYTGASLTSAAGVPDLTQVVLDLYAADPACGLLQLLALISTKETINTPLGRALLARVAEQIGKRRVAVPDTAEAMAQGLHLARTMGEDGGEVQTCEELSAMALRLFGQVNGIRQTLGAASLGYPEISRLRRVLEYHLLQARLATLQQLVTETPPAQQPG